MHRSASSLDQNRSLSRRICSCNDSDTASKRHHALYPQLLDKYHGDADDTDEHGEDLHRGDPLSRQKNPRERKTENGDHRLKDRCKARRDVLLAPEYSTVVQ